MIVVAIFSLFIPFLHKYILDMYAWGIAFALCRCSWIIDLLNCFKVLTFADSGDNSLETPWLQSLSNMEGSCFQKDDWNHLQCQHPAPETRNNYWASPSRQRGRLSVLMFWGAGGRVVSGNSRTAGRASSLRFGTHRRWSQSSFRGPFEFVPAQEAGLGMNVPLTPTRSFNNSPNSRVDEDDFNPD